MFPKAAGTFRVSTHAKSILLFVCVDDGQKGQTVEFELCLAITFITDIGGKSVVLRKKRYQRSYRMDALRISTEQIGMGFERLRS